MSDIKYCNAKSKRTGKPCRAYAMHGSEKCYHHGGRSLKGAESPMYKQGRYSKHLPSRLAAQYEQSIADPDLIALRDEIGVIDTRVAELMQRIDSGEAGRHWQQLKQLRGQMLSTTNDDKRLAYLSNIFSIIDNYSDYEVWSELYNALEQRRRLAESERKRIVDAEMMISVDRAMVLVAALTASVRQHVADRKIRQKIATDIERLITVE